MKRKSLLIMLLMAMFAPWAANAQETLTVCDGTNENTYVPIYGLYCDEGVKCEFVIPAEQLEDMTNGTISAVKFYLKSVGTNTISPTFTIFVKEVESTTLTALTGTNGATTVFNNSITFTKNTTNVEIDIPFSSDYSYGGGNLLIGIYQDGTTGYTSTYWYGVNQNYNSAWSGNGSGSGRQFLPKTTFTYEPAATDCAKPETLVASNVTGNSAILTWSGGSGTYNVEVKGGSYTDWTSVLSNTNLLSTPLSNLTAVTDYQARVQSVCDGETPTSGWKTVSFTTPCGAIAPGYTCGFEGPNTGGTTSYPLPACWTRPSGTSTSYPVVYNYNYYAHQGNYSLRFYGNTTSSSQIAVLPEIEGGVEGKRLTFYAQVSTAGSYSMSVGYMTNPDNASTFVEVESITPSESYSLYTIDFGSYTDNPSYIAIKSNMSSYYTFYVDDLALSLTPTCLPPTDLAAHNTTINSAKLSWTTHTSEQAWTVYYKTTDAANYTAQAVTTNPYTLGNLTAGSNYQYYVIANCDVDDASEPSDVCYFKTNCEAETVTNAIEENFDSYTGVQSGATNNLPQCWNYINTSTYDSYNGYPVIYNYASGSHSGSNHLRLYSYFSSSNSDYDPQDQYAIMPPMEDISTLRIKLYARKNSASYDATFHVGVMTDPTDASTFVEIGTGYAPTSTTYELFTIPFDNYTGQGSFIAFKIDAANSSYSTRSVFIDDITVEPIPGCMEPSDLAVAEEEGNPTSTSVKLQWTAGGSETNWKLQYKKASATEWTDLAETVTTNPYTLQGLDPSSTYNVRVAAWCDPNNPESVSPWSEAISFNTDCGVISTFPWGENFNTLTTGIPLCWDNSEGTTTNASYKWNYNASGHDGACVKFDSYNNGSGNTNYLRTPELALPNKDMQLSFWYMNGTTSGNEYRVYISTDNGTTKTELTESSLNGKSSWTEMEPISLADYKGQNVVILFYGKSNYGYNNIFLDDVLVEEAPSCIKPKNLACASKTAHTATFTWTDGAEGQTAWQISYSTESSFNPDNGTIVAVTHENNTIDGLTHNTTYYAYVRANCGTTEEPDYSAWCNAKATFSTLNATVAPLGLAVDNATITHSYAKVSWNAVEGNDHHASYELYYSTDATMPNDLVATSLITGITDLYYEFNDLSAETTYYVWVRDNCGDDGMSPWSSRYNFTTPSACQTPDGLATSNVSDNSATITWNTYGLTAFNLRYSTDGTNWTVKENVNTNYSITELNSNTTYQVQVQAACNTEAWSSALYFTTECGAISVAEDSYTENFNSYTGTTETYTPSSYPDVDLPDCWQFLNRSTSSSYYPQAFLTSSTTYAVSGNCLFFKSSSTTPLYAILPQFTEAISGLQLTFTYRNEDTGVRNGILYVGYMTNTSDAATFQSVYTCDQTTTKTTKTVYFENAPANSYMVFKYEGGTADNYYLSIDNVEVAPKPSCMPIGTLTVVEGTTTYNSAQLSWTLNDNTQDAWQVCINSDEDHLVDVAASECVISEGTVTYTLTGLAENSTISVKVRANCGTSQSEWSSPKSIYTPERCPAPTGLAVNNATLTQETADLTWNGESESYNIHYRIAATINETFSEGFEDAAEFEGWQAFGAVTTNTAGSSRWGRITSAAKTGSYGFSFNSWSSASDYNQYLISPERSFEGVMTFQYKCSNANSGGESFRVGYSSTDTELASFSWGTEITTTNTNWQTFTGNIPSGTKYIAINYCVTSSRYCLYVDDIVVGNEVPAGEWQPTTPINTTETTAIITGLTACTEYEVQVQGVCDNVPGNWCEALTFTTMAEGNKVFTNATTDGKWGTANNWVPAGVPGIGDDVILRASATINGDAAANKVTYENNSALTIADGGKLQINNDLSNVTVKKNIDAHTADAGWYLIASPFDVQYGIAPSAFGLITDDGSDPDNFTYDLYEWQSDLSDGLEWRNYRSHGFTLYRGDGYLYANKNNVELSYIGVIKANDEPVVKNNLDYGETHFTAWTLFGNPFMCDAYLSTENEGMAFYKMNSTRNGFEASTGVIAPMEGFFVQTSGANQSFNISRTAPEGSTSRQLNIILAQAVTSRSANSVNDNAIIRFGQGGTLEKFSFREDASKIYISQYGKDYAVVNAESQGEMPLSFRANENGTYTLSFSSENTEFSYLHLVDNLTGNDVDLLQTPSYTFDATTRDYESRFKLVFATGSNNDSDNFAFFSNGNWIINNDGKATLQVIDVTGRILSSETFNGCANVSVNAAPGVYMLRLVNGANVKVQKVVVK